MLAKNFTGIFRQISNQFAIQTKVVSRNIALKKRFYKSCSVVQSNGKYEVTLDQRKLKTPKGNVFQVESEPLALAVAAEWESQKEKIVQSSMHLTGLCWTAIDNPDKLTKENIVSELVGYVDSDTILYHSSEDDELYDLQRREWSPVSQWLSKRYDVTLEPSRNISGPVITQADKDKLAKYLSSYNFFAILGFRFSVEALKSLCLGLACTDRLLTVDKATSLSRLEEDFQSNRWGRVEWAHDINEQSTRARVAAGTLFIYANSTTHSIRKKQTAY